MENTVKWFDLSKFGASLRVLQHSPLRDTSLTCLEITDNIKFQESFQTGLDKNSSLSLFDQWDAAKNVLNFGDFENSYEDGKRIVRLFSTKKHFTLRELKTLVPGLEASDLVDVPRDQIVMTSQLEPEMAREWEQFTAETLKYEGAKVWTPIVNPFDSTYEESRTIPEFIEQNRDSFHAVYGRAMLSPFNGLVDRLHLNHYRQNALISYYVDFDKALADGWKTDQLKQVSLPYALPFHLSGKERIVALKDVRFAPEIMDISPVSYYRGNVKVSKPGIVLDFLNELAVVRNKLTGMLDQINQFSDTKETFDDKAFYALLNETFITVYEFATKDPKWNYSKAGRFPQNLDNNSSVGLSLSPLFELKPNYSEIFVSVFDDFLNLENDVADNLNEKLVSLLSIARLREVDRAEELTQEKLKDLKVAAKKTKPSIAGDGVDNFKHVDVGVKIGGARKDYAKRAMVLDDVDSMNEIERKAFVSKQNVWPPIDYSKLRENGVPPQVALALKVLKDELNTSPDFSHRSNRSFNPSVNNEEQHIIKICRDYVTAIETARDVLMDVKSIEELRQVLVTLCNQGRLDDGGEVSNYISGGSALQVQWGNDFSKMIFEANDLRGLPRKIGYAINRKMGWQSEKSDDDLWKVLVKPTKVKSEAKIAEDKHKAELDKELHSPHLENVLREGTDWRGGRDVTGEDLLSHFNFKAIEYGNWLDQKERQEVLNMAFDSFCDLADVLKLPPKELSLGNELAIAFGARGKGGRSAALAHFEPARFVINLTRLKGAGSLAHEWFHAFDLYCGNKAGYASEMKYASDVPMSLLTKGMTTRPGKADDLFAEMEKGIVKSHSNILSWFYSNSTDAKERIKQVCHDSVEKMRYQFMETALNVIKNKGIDHIDSKGLIDSVTRGKAFEDMLLNLKMACDKSREFTSVKDKIEGNVHWLVVRLATAVTIEASREAKIDLPESFLRGAHEKQSEYLENAKNLDKLRSSPYWGTTRELFARAGAAYVFDKVTLDGGRSDYLVYGAEEERYINPRFPGNPYPTGDERVKLSALFDHVFDDFRLQCLRKMEAESSSTLEM